VRNATLPRHLLSAVDASGLSHQSPFDGDFDPTLVQYTPAQTQDFYKRLVERVRRFPP